MNKSKLKFLIVDDFSMVRVMLRRTLKDLGFETVDEAVDGREALVKIEAAATAGDPYALVFCDWTMPEVTGIEVLEACRSSELMKSTPIIMVTAESEQKHIIRAINLGANEYIIKPFTQKNLEDKMTKVFNKLQINVA